MRSAIALLALAAGPAWAQDAPSCGGIGVVGSWIGGGPEASDVAASDAPLTAEAQVPIVGHAVTLLSVSEAAGIRIEVDAVEGGDVYASLYDAAGAEVASDDDGGVDFGVRMEADVEPGAYCLATRSYELGMTDVRVRAGLVETFDDGASETGDGGGGGGGGGDGGAAVATAGGGCGSPDVATLDAPLAVADLDAGVDVTATVDQQPALAFDLADALPLSITARSEDGDPLIRLLGPGGDILAENDDADGLNSRLALAEPQAAGSYCLEVEDLNGDANPITVTLSTYDPAAEQAAGVDAMETAPAASEAGEDLGALDGSTLTTVPVSTAAQWIAFDVPEGGVLLVEAVSPDGSADPLVKLFDRLGRAVGENDDGPEGLDALLLARVGPGRHMLGVRTYDDGAGEIRVLLERYVPAE